MKRVICNDWLSEDFSEEFSFDGKQIHIPARHLKRGKTAQRSVLRTIEDTEGNVLLKPTYLHPDTEAELLRYFPSWGLKIVHQIGSIPNVWVVDYKKVEL